MKAHPKLADSYAMLATLERQATADGLGVKQLEAVLGTQRERIARHVEQGQYPREQQLEAAPPTPKPDRENDR